MGINGYPATACISINDEVIHGIPSKKRVICEGDIVSIDLGAKINGFNGDNAATFAAGTISPEAKRLCDTTKESLYLGIQKAVAGGRIGDIGFAVASYCEARGYSVVREFVGHGVGYELHEDPSVPNYGTPGRGVRLLPGMTIAIEPMINMGKAGVKTLPDGWTVKTRDGKLSAHFEHTVAITSGSPKILTLL
jgi:methionyl aminopeptidase